MKTASALVVVVGVVLLLSFASAIGCKSKPKPEPTGQPAPVTVEEINSAKFQNALVPQAAQTAFAHDHPAAVIDTIEVQNTSAGEMFYQIRYTANGSGGVARYFASGKAVP
jgi:hypothetical protein